MLITTVSAPSAFVNITFHPTASHITASFVAARPAQTNFIHAHLRPRGPENDQKRKTLVTTIMNLWDAHINNAPGATLNAEGSSEGRLDNPRALHNVFVFEALVAGSEQGFLIPMAGEDGKWGEENMKAFEDRAGRGDESMGRLVEEMKAEGKNGLRD
jgi:hypothetical protein